MKNSLIKGLMVFLTMLCTGLTYSQDVSGTVSDSSGPLPGATILVKGTTNGAQTDLDGKFTIKKVGPNAVLVFSFIGLKSQEVKVGGKSTVKVTLTADNAELKEVVVIGYGSVKKKDATGAVDQINSKKFDNVAATNPASLLQGKVSGVQVTSSSGEPGGGMSIRIRGTSSIRSGNGPLIVVDGVPLDGGDTAAGGADTGLGTSSAKSPLNFINQNDIESMSILKDASSTAIYGARGANGVIIITTKKSKSAEPTLNYSSSVGFSSYASKFEGVLSSAQYLAAGGTNAGSTGYDWKKAVLQNGLSYNNDLSYGVRSGNSSTRISIGASNTEGIVKNSGIDKYTISMSNSTEFLGGFLTLEPKIMYAGIRDKSAMISNNAGYIGNIIGSALYWNPTLPIYNADGSYHVKGNDYLNPVQLENAYTDYTNTSRILASMNTKIKINNHLKYNFLFAVDNSNSSRKSQLLPTMQISGVAQTTYAQDGNTYYGQANITNVNKFNKTFEHTLDYNKDFSDNFNLDLIGGYSYYNYNFNQNGITGIGFNPNQTNLIDDVQGSITWKDGTFGSASYRNEVNLQSYFARATASLYKNLNVNATIRKDGSSKLGANNKYGNFYSVGAAYKIFDSKEGLVNDLKIRGSYGLTGNQEFSPNSAIAFASYVSPSSYGNQINSNPNLKWETTLSSGIGLDFTLLNNKLTGGFDYFQRSTKDLIFAKDGTSTQPSPNSNQFVNLPGTLENKGYEISLSYKILNTQDLTWDISANTSFLSNKLKNFPLFVPMGAINGQGLSGATAEVLQNNAPLYSYYMFDYKGLAADGSSIYTDANGNPTGLGTASKHLLNKTALPKMSAGFTSSFSYKGFDAAVSFYGAFGNYIYNNTSEALFFKGAFPLRNITPSVASSTQSASDPNTPSTKYLEKGDFLRMGNLTFGYTLTSKFLEQAKIKSARFYVNGQNLLLFTKYTGFDPEVDVAKTFNGVPSAGIDYLAYPKSKTISFGVNVNF